MTHFKLLHPNQHHYSDQFLKTHAIQNIAKAELFPLWSYDKNWFQISYNLIPLTSTHLLVLWYSRAHTSQKIEFNPTKLTFNQMKKKSIA